VTRRAFSNFSSSVADSFFTCNCRLPYRSSREALAAANKWLSWPEIVACAIAVVSEWEGLERMLRREQRGADVAFVPIAAAGHGGEESLRRRTALAAQAALLVELYTSICPGRGLEYWTLRFATSPTEMPSTERQNLLVVCPVNGALLRLSQHKTSKSLGVEEVPLPTSQFAKVIAAILTHRSTLLRAKAHSFVFCRASDGEPFSSSGRWALYLQSTFAAGWQASRITTVTEQYDANLEAPKISVNSLRKGKRIISRYYDHGTPLCQKPEQLGTLCKRTNTSPPNLLFAIDSVCHGGAWRPKRDPSPERIGCPCHAS
jgi:hypothetical protein